MTISATQTTAALPTTNARTPQAAATPAMTDGARGARGAAPSHMPPLYDPFDRIQALLRELLTAIRELRPPGGGPFPPGKPPFEPPFEPPFRPPFKPPFKPPFGRCPHMPPPGISPIPGPLPIPFPVPAPAPHAH